MRDDWRHIDELLAVTIAFQSQSHAPRLAAFLPRYHWANRHAIFPEPCVQTLVLAHAQVAVATLAVSWRVFLPLQTKTCRRQRLHQRLAVPGLLKIVVCCRA